MPKPQLYFMPTSETCPNTTIWVDNPISYIKYYGTVYIIPIRGTSGYTTTFEPTQPTKCIIIYMALLMQYA